MSCGCSKDPIYEKAMRATRGAMCVACAGPDASTCPMTGSLVSLHVRGKPCPKGRHPNREGILTWLWVRWFGTPFPLRAWLWTCHYSDRDWAAFRWQLPGCGCVVALKTRWERMKARILVSDH
jgi:hypothetical protein